MSLLAPSIVKMPKNTHPINSKITWPKMVFFTEPLVLKLHPKMALPETKTRIVSKLYMPYYFKHMFQNIFG